MSEDLLSLQQQILEEEDLFLKNKMVFRPDLNKKDAFSVLKGELDQHIKRIFNEYDMNYCPFGSKHILKCSLSPLQVKYVKAVSEFLCQNASLKPLPTIVGKSAEMAFRNAMNNLFHLFNIRKRIQLNSKNFVYGGDGGGDFFVGNHIFDVKYRNDSPSHGMILEKAFIERTPDDVILIHVTNSASIKLGGNDTGLDKTLPLALSGWITVKEFKRRASMINNSRDSMAVDNLDSILDLLFLVLDDHIKSEELFLYR